MRSGTSASKYSFWLCWMCLAEFSEGGAGHRLCEKPEFSHSKWEFHTKDIVQDFRGSCVTFRDTPAVLFYQLTLDLDIRVLV